MHLCILVIDYQAYWSPSTVQSCAKLHMKQCTYAYVKTTFMHISMPMASFKCTWMYTSCTNVPVDITLLDMQRNMHENIHLLLCPHLWIIHIYIYIYISICKHMSMLLLPFRCTWTCLTYCTCLFISTNMYAKWTYIYILNNQYLYLKSCTHAFICLRILVQVILHNPILTSKVYILFNVVTPVWWISLKLSLWLGTICLLLIFSLSYILWSTYLFIFILYLLSAKIIMVTF